MSGKSVAEHKLITIAYSHFCEKARWGLDLSGLPYEESAYLPFFHMVPVALATRGSSDAQADGSSTRNSTPVLITPAGQRICDSSRILHYLDKLANLQLFDESGEAARWEKRLSDDFGKHTRRFGYHYLLLRPDLVDSLMKRSLGGLQARAFSLLQPALNPLLRKALRINSESANRSRVVIESFVSEIDELLSDGRKYLCANRFTAADLCLAALFAPSLLVSCEEGYGSTFPTMAEVDGEVLEFAKRMRDTRTGEFALQVYRNHRTNPR